MLPGSRKIVRGKKPVAAVDDPAPRRWSYGLALQFVKSGHISTDVGSLRCTIWQQEVNRISHVGKHRDPERPGMPIRFHERGMLQKYNQSALRCRFASYSLRPNELAWLSSSTCVTGSRTTSQVI